MMRTTIKDVWLSDKWQRRFIDIATVVEGWSRDPSTKIGAVIVKPDTKAIIATGYNGFPRGVFNYDKRWNTRPDKYEFVVHAEVNAILNAARMGVSVEGCIMVLSWEPTPCEGCAKAIIQSGIRMIYGPDRPFTGKGNGIFTRLGKYVELMGMVSTN